MLIAVWDEDNEQHIAEHGLSRTEVEYVLNNPTDHATSRTTGRPMVFGYTPAERFIAVVYEPLDEVYVYPITAFEVEP